MAPRPTVSMAEYRAPSLFQPHRARQAMRDAHNGKIAPLLGVYFGLSTVPTSLFIAPLGFDWAWIDWEHSSCNVETMTAMVHNIMFASEGKTMPFVRVPGHHHDAIGYALDAGASLIIPQVETVEQAQFVVSSAKFGTRHKGTRSAPPFRLIPGVTDGVCDESLTLHQNLNEQAAIILQIETLEGIKNLDTILTEVKDIDGIWLGTLDARISMNLPGNFDLPGDEPEWLEAVKMAETAMKKHPEVAFTGFSFGDDEAIAQSGKGKAMSVVAGDVMALQNALETALARARKILPTVSASDASTNGTSSGPVHGRGKVGSVFIKEAEVVDMATNVEVVEA